MDQLFRGLFELRQEAAKKTKRTFKNPQVIYVTLQLLALGFVVINLFTMVFFYQALHRRLAIEASDFQTAIEIVAGIACALPIWKVAEYVFFSRLKFKVKKRFRYRFALVANVLFISLTIGLWFSLEGVSNKKMHLGTRASMQNQHSTAIKYFKHALYLVPERADAHFQLANVYEEITEFDQAIEQYWQAIYLMDDPFEAYNNLARLYIRQALEQPDLASVKYEEALDLLAHAGRVIEARSDTSLEIHRVQEATIQKNKAWLYMLLDDFTSAQQELTQAKQLLDEASALDRHPFISCLEAAGKWGSKLQVRVAENRCRAILSGLTPLERNFARTRLKPIENHAELKGTGIDE